MPTTLLMLPPQTTTTRAWATRLAGALPQIAVVVAETEHDAAGSGDQGTIAKPSTFSARSR